MARQQGTREQWEARRSQILIDQHGREYSAEIDTDALAPVGPIMPRNFKQPVPTPSKYIKPIPGRLNEIKIDYEAWKRDVAAGEYVRTLKMRKLAEDMYGSQFGNAMKDPPPELLAKVGPGPIPIEFVLAMESGQSKWALGLRKADGSYYPKPKWVTPELEDRLLASLKQVWSGEEAFLGGLPSANPGQFVDDEEETVESAVSAFADAMEDEEEPVLVAVPSNIPAPVPVGDFIPKRPPGRPRKNP